MSRFLKSEIYYRELEKLLNKDEGLDMQTAHKIAWKYAGKIYRDSPLNAVMSVAELSAYAKGYQDGLADERKRLRKKNKSARVTLEK